MPTYSYRCGTCGHDFELRQSFAADPEQRCPLCASAARRRFHPVGIIYKGSGFYTTDYRAPSEGVALASDAGSSDAGSSDD